LLSHRVEWVEALESPVGVAPGGAGGVGAGGAGPVGVERLHGVGPQGRLGGLGPGVLRSIRTRCASGWPLDAPDAHPIDRPERRGWTNATFTSPRLTLARSGCRDA
jgi:hypothetical protein